MVKKILASFVLFSFLCTGCATLYNPATEKKEFIFINSQMEASLGKNASMQLAQQKQILQQGYLHDRFSAIGERIARVSDRKDIAYQFFVVEDKTLNAMTLPGGLIYINSGLMQILDDDEVAFVIAHEVGHVSARHIAKKIQANMAYQTILGLAFASVGKKNPDAAASAATAANAVFNLVSLSYSRQDEYQADALGVKYARLAGFNASASISSLEKIRQNEGKNWKILEYFRTHPYVDERIKALRKIAF